MGIAATHKYQNTVKTINKKEKDARYKQWWHCNQPKLVRASDDEFLGVLDEVVAKSLHNLVPSLVLQM